MPPPPPLFNHSQDNGVITQSLRCRMDDHPIPRGNDRHDSNDPSRILLRDRNLHA